MLRVYGTMTLSGTRSGIRWDLKAKYTTVIAAFGDRWRLEHYSFGGYGVMGI